MKTVYVAGAYTQGDTAVNVAAAIRAGNLLVQAGFAPFVPHLFHFMHMHQPAGYEAWMAIDFEWVGRCDALVRLPGVSPGADREVALALEKGIPVYYGVSEFLHETGAQRLAVGN
jgi:hypothetical protein